MYNFVIAAVVIAIIIMILLNVALIRRQKFRNSQVVPPSPSGVSATEDVVTAGPATSEVKRETLADESASHETQSSYAVATNAKLNDELYQNGMSEDLTNASTMSEDSIDNNAMSDAVSSNAIGMDDQQATSSTDATASSTAGHSRSPWTWYVDADQEAYTDALAVLDAQPPVIGWIVWRDGQRLVAKGSDTGELASVADEFWHSALQFADQAYLPGPYQLRVTGRRGAIVLLSWGERHVVSAFLDASHDDDFEGLEAWASSYLAP